jgi:hypothetical protein
MTTTTRSLLALALVATAFTVQAKEGDLRSECAAQNAPKLAIDAKAGNEFQFEYYKGTYRGEAKAGKKLACTPSQYSDYLASVDPARLMATNPTAAGGKKAETKPAAKPEAPAAK